MEFGSIGKCVLVKLRRGDHIFLQSSHILLLNQSTMQIVLEL